MSTTDDIVSLFSNVCTEETETGVNSHKGCNDCIQYGSKYEPTIAELVKAAKKAGLVQTENKDKHAAVARYSLYPLQDPESFEFYQKQMANMWITSELGTFTTDRDHYNKRLTPESRKLLDIALAFFLPGDGLVNNNLAHNFLLEATTMEEQMMFTAQMCIEAVHAHTYGLIVYMIHGEDGTMRLQKMVADSDYMQLKIEAMEKWTVSTRSRVERLLAWACIEGIFFSVLFAIIFWFRSQGNLLPTVILANEMISRDETLHRDYACHLYKKLGGLPTETALEIVKYFVDIEERFIDWLLKEEHQELTRANMKSYLHLVADNLLVEAGLPKYFNGKNPFPWMDDIALVQKHNFYEIRGGSYTRASIKDSASMDTGTNSGSSMTEAYQNCIDVDF